MRPTTPLLLLAFEILVLTPIRAQEADRLGNPDLFPGARCDAAETSALRRPDGPGPVVYRTGRPFEVVLNFYRVAARQTVQVTREDLGRRFAGVAEQLEQPAPPARLLQDPFVQRFNARASRAAWRQYARRYAGREQLVAEGQRVTIYRPYLSQQTFRLIPETVIVLQQPGGTCHARASEPRPHLRDRRDGRAGLAADRRPDRF